MKLQTTITGIGTTARDQAEASVQQALAKREAELAQLVTRRTRAGGTTAGSPPSGGRT